MGLFDRIKEPIFLKDSNGFQDQLKALEDIYNQADDDLRKRIEKEMIAVKAGIAGENNILYELKNSHYPMYILHDITYIHENHKAQIDFVIVTRGLIFIIECKNLYGEITVDNKGQFIRKINHGNHYTREAIYSPIEQNRKHLDLIKQMALANNSKLRGISINKWFDTWYRGIVVIANPKCILDDRYAPKEIKNQIIRADQLIEYIKTANQDPTVVIGSEKAMTESAERLLARSVNNPVDYTEKYRKELIAQTEKKELVNKSEETKEGPICPKCGSPMVKRIARRGENAGSWFYGCSNFPRCRGIISAEQYENLYHQL